MVATSNQISQFMDRQASQGQQQQVATLERGLPEFMGDGLVAMDREGYCIYANSAAGKLLGYGAAMMLGQNLHDLLHPADAMPDGCDAYRCPVLQSLQSTQPCHIDDHQVFFTRDRVAVPVAYTTAPIIDQGLIRGVVITVIEESARRQEIEALESSLKEKDAALQKAIAAVAEARAAIQPPPPADVKILPPRRPVVWVVDEDKAARAQAWQQLRDLNYDVVQAAAVDEALFLCEQTPDAVDLLITDCILSQMSGKDFAERMKTLKPGLQVLFVSTYTPAAIDKLALLEPGAPFLQKPLDPTALAQKIKNLLV